MTDLLNDFFDQKADFVKNEMRFALLAFLGVMTWNVFNLSSL